MNPNFLEFSRIDQLEQDLQVLVSLFIFFHDKQSDWLKIKDLKLVVGSGV